MKVWAMAFFDLKALGRDWRALAAMLLLPVLFTWLVGVGIAPRLESNTFLEPFAVAAVDLDGTVESRTLLAQLEDSPAFRGLVTLRRVGYGEALRLLAADQVAAAVVIPEGFVARMAQGENLPVEVIGNPSRPLQTALVRNLAESGANLVTAAQSGVNTLMVYLDRAGVPVPERQAILSRAVAGFSLHALGRGAVLRTDTVSATGGVSPLQYYSAALGSVFALAAALAGLRILSRDQDAGLLARLTAHGVAPAQVAAAKALTVALVHLGQLLLLYGFLAGLGRYYFQGRWLAALAVLAAVAAAHGGLVVLIAALAPTAGAANLAALAVTAAFALAGGGILPEPYLPPALRMLGLLTVTRWAITGLLGGLFGVEQEAVLPSIAVLGGMAIVYTGLAGVALARTRG